MNKIIRRVLLREKADSETFVAYLKNKGVSVGENVTFYSPQNTLVDTSSPWLLKIGNHVKITHGVIILTHDYSWSVLKRYPKSAGAIFGAQSPVTIGDNVFIGMNAIITRNVTIGDNVIIGAGSVVTSDCESNGVYAGNPARKIMTMDEFLEKRQRKQLEEAQQYVKRYRSRLHKNPPKNQMTEYFMLFCDADSAQNEPVFLNQMRTCNNFEDCIHYMRKKKPMFSSYEDFLNTCGTPDEG